MKQSLTVPLLLAAAGAEAGSLAARDSDCKDVHVFLAKGNNEPYPGRQGTLATAICKGLDSCDYEDIQFYNPLESVYCDSVFEGAKNGKDQITAYNKKCPDSMLVVSGYSQGAHVVGDILGGGGGTFFEGCVQNSNDGFDPSSSPANKIVAAMVFGDTRHTAGQSYNVLSGAGDNGLFPRTSEMLSNLAKYGSVLRSYCVETDPICAGGDVVADHLNYFDIYSDQAAAWVQEQVKAAGNESSTTTTTTASASKSTSKSKSTSTEKETTTTESGSETTGTPSVTKSKSSSSSSKASSAPASSTKVASTAALATASGGSSSGTAASATGSDAPAATGSAASSFNLKLGAVFLAAGVALAL